MDGPHALLALQERDTEADQLRHRRAHLPERARLDQVIAEQAAAEIEGAAATAERDELVRRQGELEADLIEIEKRMTDLDRHMRSGMVTAPKDLQAMAAQLESLRRRRSGVEDAELEVMEALEPLEARLDGLQDRWSALDAETTRLRGEVARAEAAMDAELERVTAARGEALTGVPPDLIATYDRLRKRLGGVAVAPMVGASCGGCHLTLSASEVDRVRRVEPGAVVTCEQCGRILVR